MKSFQTLFIRLPPGKRAQKILASRRMTFLNAERRILREIAPASLLVAKVVSPLVVDHSEESVKTRAAVTDELVLPSPLAHEGPFIAVTNAMKNYAHGLSAKPHEKLQQIAFGEKQVVAAGDLQSVGSPALTHG